MERNCIYFRTIHHTPFFCKRKDVFCNFFKKSANCSNYFSGKPQKYSQCIQQKPEQPQHRGARQQPEEGKAQQNARKEKQPEQAAAHIQGKEQQGWRQHQPEQQVTQVCQLRQPQAEGPEGRPEQAQHEAQGHGEQKLPQLAEYRQVHPNSRAQNPSFLPSS